VVDRLPVAGTFGRSTFARLLAVSRRRPEAVVAVLWLAFAMVCAARFPWHGLWHDDACYISLGRALTNGVYSLPQLPGNGAETRYPPLHPASLAVCWLAGATAERAWLFAIPGLLVTSLGVWAWGRVLHLHVRLRAGQRTAALALAAFAPGWLQVVQCAMAEPWLFTLLPVALLALGRDGGRHPWRAGLLFGAAALAKSIALVPLCAVAAQIVLRGRLGATARLLAGAAVLAMPWWVWVAMHPSDGESTILRYYQGYGSLFCPDLATWLQLLPDRVRDLSSGTVRQAIAGIFMPEVWPALPAAARTALIGTTAIAALGVFTAVARRAVQGPPVFAATCGLWAISLGVVDGSWRYAIPVLPIAMATLARWFGRAWPAWFTIFGVLSLPATIAMVQLDPERSARMWRENVPTAGYERLAAAVREHVPADAVVGAEVDAWLHLHTGRRSVMPTPMPEHSPCARDEAAFAALCRREWQRLGVSWFVIEPRMGEEERSLLLAAWQCGEIESVECCLPEGFWLLRALR
jgi:hypothetical protein